QDESTRDPSSRDEPSAPVPETAEHRADVRRRTATVRGIELGRARPEIIVPLVGADEEELLAQAGAAVATSARIMEWRLDRFRPDLEESTEHREAVLAALPALRGRLGPDRALLVTFRTAAEGGRRALSDRDLGILLDALLSRRRAGTQAVVDLVDIETARDPRTVERVISSAHRHGTVVIGSHHDEIGRAHV